MVVQRGGLNFFPGGARIGSLLRQIFFCPLPPRPTSAPSEFAGQSGQDGYVLPLYKRLLFHIFMQKNFFAQPFDYILNLNVTLHLA